MQIWKFCFLVLFTQSLILAEEEDDLTVAEEIGEHQLARLAELLMPYECEELLEALAESKEKISARSNIVKRDTSSSKESEAECRKKLKDMLHKNKMDVYYDRLTWALRHINRVDIALELSKNLNQDKILNLKRYADGYHDFVKSIYFQEAESETGQPKRLKRGWNGRNGGSTVKNLETYGRAEECQEVTHDNLKIHIIEDKRLLDGSVLRRGDPGHI
ncbi:transmembrane and death domain protein 1 isoform X3 [Syngnathus scovelli]|uniref:transmembrane and death domain protein 1 isoform X3 n=1 Tax=Syngnathus scovelli TaxID=161590 RepID=UPI0035CAD2D0